MVFLHRHVEFRLPELEAVAELVSGRGVLAVQPPCSSSHPWSPFLHVWLPSDDAARAIAARTLLVKARTCCLGEMSCLIHQGRLRGSQHIRGKRFDLAALVLSGALPGHVQEHASELVPRAFPTALNMRALL